MKKWEQLENIINKKLENTISSVGEAVSTATPEKMRAWKSNTINKISRSTGQVLKAPSNFTKKIGSLTENTLGQAQGLKDKMHNSIQEGRKARYNKLGIAAGIVALLEWALMPLYKKIALIFTTMQPATLASGIVLMTVSGIAGIGIYNNSHKIVEEAGLVERAPAAIEKPDPRPKYYKRNEKELLVSNVVVPSYIEGRASLRKLEIDFTIISSNRYIREYFFDNSYLLEDVLNSKIEPIIPGFPLGDEGKLILKDKIRSELNLLLKRMKIEGSIESIYISSILAA